MASKSKYPIHLAVDYPKGQRNRTTVLFRIFTLIPIGIVLCLLMGGGEKSAGVGFVVLPTVLMLVFQHKYPKWWYDWNSQCVQFVFRVAAYAALLTDEYPSTDLEQTIHARLPYPKVAKDLNRWLPLVKWLLALPHYLVLAVLTVAAVAAILVAWFSILFTGTMSKTLFSFILGVMRWHLRVLGYAVLLLTDKYPPFSLEA